MPTVVKPKFTFKLKNPLFTSSSADREDFAEMHFCDRGYLSSYLVLERQYVFMVGQFHFMSICMSSS